MRARCLVVLCAGLACSSALADPLPIKLGAMGDSLSDEYFEESYDYAKNWSILLVERRSTSITMGPTAAQGGAGATWGEPRRTGYAFNWARYDADSSTALTQGQHTSLAAQVASSGVSHAVVAIGANDFAPTSSAYFNIYWGFWSSTQIDNYVNARIANIDAAVATLSQAQGPQGKMGIVLGNCVDFGGTPIVRHDEARKLTLGQAASFAQLPEPAACLDSQLLHIVCGSMLRMAVHRSLQSLFREAPPQTAPNSRNS